MPLQTLSFNLPGEDITAIWKQEVEDFLADFEETASNIFSDGIMPGTHRPPAKQRLMQYLQATDPQDFAKLFDEDYLLRLQNGLEAPPVSKFWLNQLSIRTSYDRNRKDFIRLLTGADRPTVRQGRV